MRLSPKQIDVLWLLGTFIDQMKGSTMPWRKEPLSLLICRFTPKMDDIVEIVSGEVSEVEAKYGKYIWFSFLNKALHAIFYGPIEDD